MRREDELDDDTIVRPVVPSLIEPAAGGVSLADADTVLRAPTPPRHGASLAGAPVAPQAPPAPPRAAPPGSGSGSASDSAPASMAEEPRIAALRIGTHEPILLDVPAYIGRKPRSPRITSGRLPRLVMVPSPSREVSSTHVEVRQEGSAVVVTDLGSTNGTVVTPPLGTPLTLRQGESVVAVHGTTVDIGDGIRVIIDARPAPSDSRGDA